MAVIASADLVHIAFDERFQFGSPYPRGLAIGWALQTGDATGGVVQFTFNALSGFLYRPEFIHIQVNGGPVVDETAEIELVHGWARDRSGFGGGNPFETVHNFPAELAPTNVTYIGTAGQWQSIRHFPMGQTDLSTIGAQALIQIVNHTNTNTFGYTRSVVFTYWPLEATYRAGFLSSFYEAPVAPPAA